MLKDDVVDRSLSTSIGRRCCPFHRQADRAGAELCRPGGDRHREHAAAQRIAQRTDDLTEAGAADRDRRKCLRVISSSPQRATQPVFDGHAAERGHTSSAGAAVRHHDARTRDGIGSARWRVARTRPPESAPNYGAASRFPFPLTREYIHWRRRSATSKIDSANSRSCEDGCLGGHGGRSSELAGARLAPAR